MGVHCVGGYGSNHSLTDTFGLKSRCGRSLAIEDINMFVKPAVASSNHTGRRFSFSSLLNESPSRDTIAARYEVRMVLDDVQTKVQDRRPRGNERLGLL